MRKLILTVILSLLVASVVRIPAGADSIWERTSTSPYSVSKAFRVGDIVTVIILESATAAQKAGTNTSASDNLATDFNHTMQFLGIAPSNSLSGDYSNAYKGSGDTSRTSNVTAKVAAIVTKVLPNGNVAIDGEHRVEVNGEQQILKITGIIRPKDVTISNTIYSYQVAAADVSIKGKGSVADAEQPGWVPRFFNWLF